MPLYCSASRAWRPAWAVERLAEGVPTSPRWRRRSASGESYCRHVSVRSIAVHPTPFPGSLSESPVRDSEELSAGSFPVFAAGVTHRGPYKDGPGEVNVPIAINGMVIQPGDLVCGDADGVVSVPFGSVEELFTAATKKHAAETRQMEAIKTGNNDRAWVDATLERLGCFIE
ncbi:hypothetical protein [Phyllobacterium brassicacearum]|uniref:RraA family protein n=1 Tax=Phyllobacterium brassicacearum TaxID=314235 RepID=UPI003CCB0FC5